MVEYGFAKSIPRGLHLIEINAPYLLASIWLYDEDDMEPPWKKFPTLERNSIGWRMGPGEDYYDRFYKWYSSLTDGEADEFSANNPTPSDWDGYYDLIRKNPWHIKT